MHVVIIGLGPSEQEYSNIVKRCGGRHAFCDQVWCINALGAVYDCDLVFHMDDVRIQEIRAKARPESNIAHMLKWLKTTKKTVITSRAHSAYPALAEFPLENVLREFPNGYFNSTAAYAVAYALALDATKITCFGMDYTYPNAHDAEKGRACVEFWLGMAAARGVQLSVPKTTSLLDACHPQAERFYGYDCVDLHFEQSDAGLKIGMTNRVTLPTADEIEHAYDHSRHPNPMMVEERDAPENRAHARASEVK